MQEATEGSHWAAGVLAASGRRQTVINWPEHVKRVVDDYRPHVPSLAHAVQKDAIQNSWDARTNRRRATNWRCKLEFLIDSAGRRFFVITDSGTTGLTGDVLQPDQYELDMPEAQRWARFESLAFTHSTDAASQHLGARGQGKFILVGASRAVPQGIFYDTLRGDGVYRLGVRLVQATESPVYAWDGADAVEKLAELAPDIPPLTQVGTRVVIPDPDPDLEVACRDGSLSRFIAETWWPIIVKHGADIRVAVSDPSGTIEARVQVGDELRLPPQDSSRYKVWLVENRGVTSVGETLKVKRMHVAFDNEGSVSQELQGVALVRGGMVVMRLPMQNVAQHIASAVTGYVEFDEDLDLAMKALEAPTHYEFNLRRGFGFAVKQLVSEQLAQFAAAKLGIGGERQQHEAQQQRDAERRALAAINRAARQLGLTGRRGLGGGGGGGGGGGAPKELIAAQLDEPTLPAPDTRRVEYDETVKNLRMRAVNYSDSPARVRLSLYLTRDDSEVAVFLNSWELEVLANSKSDWSASHQLHVDPAQHLPGAYVLRAKLLVLTSPYRPKMFEHRDAFKFWIAEDPPQGGIFEDIDALHYLGDAVTTDGEAVPGGLAGGWKFQYNLLHPACKRVANEPDSLTDYLFELMAREMVFVDLKSDPPKLFSDSDLEDRSAQQRRSRDIVSGVLYDYFD